MAVVLYGCGSSIVVDIEETCARLGIRIAALVKNMPGADFAISGAPVVAADAITDELRSIPFTVPIFTPAHRRTASEEARRKGFASAATLIDPTAVVAASATLGAGTYVNCGVAIGGAVSIGEFAFVNRNASIGHHGQIADFASVGPGATIAGRVRLGRGAVVCAGAVVLPEIEIGANSVVAAGAVVREPVGDHCLVAGNPARLIKVDYAGYQHLSV